MPLPSKGQGRIAYVVNIPQSTTAHQASDRRYYKRQNFKAEPMDDYEVRGTLNRAKNPILDPRMDWNRIDYDAGQDIAKFQLNFIVTNRG